MCTRRERPSDVVARARAGSAGASVVMPVWGALRAAERFQLAAHRDRRRAGPKIRVALRPGARRYVGHFVAARKQASHCGGEVLLAEQTHTSLCFPDGPYNKTVPVATPIDPCKPTLLCLPAPGSRPREPRPGLLLLIAGEERRGPDPRSRCEPGCRACVNTALSGDARFSRRQLPDSSGPARQFVAERSCRPRRAAQITSSRDIACETLLLRW